MIASHPRRPPVLAFGAAALLAVALFGFQVGSHWPAEGDTLARIVLLDSVLPRGAVALLAGAALGLAGALLQRVLRNPIADSSTLGVAAGAQLAMVLATVYAPVLMERAREPTAFAGGAAALLLILALSRRRDFEPVTVALCGMLVSLVAASLSATVILANGDYMMSLFIWGGGSLEQLGWDVSFTLGLRLLAGGLVAAALIRPLTLLGFEDERARSLGLGVAGMRLLLLGLAVVLSTSVVAYVGVIGFVGLAAPNLARLAGARTPKAVLLAAPLVGALLLLLTDGAVQALSFGGTEILPTGAATALIGGPILLWMLPRLHAVSRAPTAPAASPRRQRAPRLVLAGLALALLLVSTLALLFGPGPDAWQLATGAAFDLVAPWRWPRILAAASAGVMLSAAGFALQRVSGNPLASPEVLGVSSGSGLGLAAVLLLLPDAGIEARTLGAAAGAGVALAVVLGLAARRNFGPERLLLGGIAIGSLSGAAVTTVIARGGPEGAELLNWLSGSTQRLGPADALTAAALAVLLAAPLPFLSRWLALLPLGPPFAGGLGLSPRLAGGTLALLAALLSAVASLTVGPLSFVGLMAPHMARLAGFARPAGQFAASVLIGALLMVFADWMARTLTAPYQLPLGLFASLVGGPYMVWLLGRAPRR
ncbi:Fe(3+)-hydroxamate ABC transporter permease FhuB [Aureimonas leprariae]|uniref:Fe(3+)-hydroxamate ABC transporter permease FhuB n=1 Tax=Plantimonas leprariae TaxID=2615207 RepID=A0A7V7PLY0_9HYPH|nr:Fe(3+)-hydroxamate ABC transporter permease FhuB [Aureimonas leprariae]KAB0677705.1 Fe(3+)-hydroxamate ABC transporter permease FhuB [Aureimonas leprariae]